MGLPWVFGAISMFLLLAGLVLLRLSRFKTNDEVLVSRLTREWEVPEGKPLSRLEREKLRIGLSLSSGMLGTLLFLWFCLLFSMFVIGGWKLLLLILLGSLLTLRIYFTMRYRRRVKKMLSQLPQMLEHMIRSIKSGRTLGDATVLAMKAAPEPLHQGIGRSRRFIERGGRLDDALDNFAELYERDEFRLLALSVRVNLRYGGSANEVIQNLVFLIREREQASDQLRAMTGETRISAVVLGGMPLVIGVYIMIYNPDFLLGLWMDPSGKVILASALLLQAVGSLLLWRMLRSI